MNETHLKQIDEETTCPGQMSPIILQLYCTYIFRKLNMNIKKVISPNYPGHRGQ